ncbi:hypothetical protein PUN28_000486 [Cardiocondyla obscurior]|uniref:Uncharacterized protein n=1 Tax=Cardiocondyla obscurior TaxID=286306 RepID=A0AAW2GZS3_9HYME
MCKSTNRIRVHERTSFVIVSSGYMEILLKFANYLKELIFLKMISIKLLSSLRSFLITFHTNGKVTFYADSLRLLYGRLRGRESFRITSLIKSSCSKKSALSTSVLQDLGRPCLAASKRTLFAHSITRWKNLLFHDIWKVFIRIVKRRLDKTRKIGGSFICPLYEYTADEIREISSVSFARRSSRLRCSEAFAGFFSFSKKIMYLRVNFFFFSGKYTTFFYGVSVPGLVLHVVNIHADGQTIFVGNCGISRERNLMLLHILF